ncbi:MAG TPA: nucleotidyltransferase family protein [Jatrophihabitantaceae bacterium]
MLEARMEGILRATPTLMRVLTIIRDLELPDGLVMSGAVYQPEHFGQPYEPYTPLTHSAEALERFTATAFAVGVRLSGDRLRIDAPFGLDDLFAMRLRPNPIRKTTGFEATAASARQRWPEATIEPASPPS